MRSLSELTRQEPSSVRNAPSLDAAGAWLGALDGLHLVMLAAPPAAAALLCVLFLEAAVHGLKRVPISPASRPDASVLPDGPCTSDAPLHLGSPPSQCVPPIPISGPGRTTAPVYHTANTAHRTPVSRPIPLRPAILLSCRPRRLHALRSAVPIDSPGTFVPPARRGCALALRAVSTARHAAFLECRQCLHIPNHAHSEYPLDPRQWPSLQDFRANRSRFRDHRTP